MAKSRNDQLEEKVNLVFASLGELQEKIENQEKQIEPVKEQSVLKKHFDAIVENALNSPHTTLSGLAVVGFSIGSKMFPQYAQTLTELQVYATGLTGVTAGNAIINKSTQQKQVPPLPPKNETDLYG